MLITLLGFLTGALIGLTGTGGGVLLTPLLLLSTSFPAVVIIGTDIVHGAATKLFGVLEHRRLGQVHWPLAKFLIAGSVPGTLAGILFLRVLKAHMLAAELDHALRTILALILVGVSFFLPFIRRRRSSWFGALPDLDSTSASLKLVAVGAAVAFVVAITSIGSGSLMMVFLLLVVPLPLGALVGTDILFGLVTMALAGSLHLGMGHFSFGLLLRLLAGSIPGVVLGSRLTRRIPARYFDWVFSLVYFSLGARLLAG